jgi:tight adherence protein C
MSDLQLILFVVAAVGLIAAFASQFIGGGDASKLRDRLKGSGQFTAAPSESDGRSAFADLASKVGQFAAEPFMPKTREKQSTLRKKLARAGIYSATSIRLMTGAKVICAIGGLVGGYLVGTFLLDMAFLGLAMGGLIGYFLPLLWLNMKIKRNQKALTYGLADTLDLMVVCVEAGLTVDSAMQRVGQEMINTHPDLARELSIAHMETRVGLSRAESLKNLGQRTGNPALQSLSAMLVQAERFGTSIAGALRIHADSLRLKRQLAAEESAAKASVKMTFPLVLFIFPATFIILAGPTVLNLMNSELFK